jgi:hypothetical protein
MGILELRKSKKIINLHGKYNYANAGVWKMVSGADNQ